MRRLLNASLIASLCASLISASSLAHADTTGSGHNEDGTQSYVTISPGISGTEFVRDDHAARPTLILRDAQHEYRLVAAR